VKKKRQARDSAAPCSRPCEPLLTQESEEGAGQEYRAARSSGPRRLSRVTIGTIAMRAVLVGANVLLREGLARILTAAGFRIIASTPCADDHLLSTLPQEQPVLFIIDISDDFDAGLRRITCFKRGSPGGRVVVLADQHHLAKMVAAFRAGANAYLVKVTTCETFVKSLV
jgi:ActR/RegA family two-component response regulator